MKFLAACVVAAVLGYLQSWLVSWAMAVVALHSPFPAWLIQEGLSGPALVAVAIAIDFPMVVAIWLPAALLLAWLRPRIPWLYLAVAILPAFLVLNSALGSTDSAVLMLGLVPSIAAPATALHIVLWFKRRRQMPANSFKPKPLRGPA